MTDEEAMEAVHEIRRLSGVLSNMREEAMDSLRGQYPYLTEDELDSIWMEESNQLGLVKKGLPRGKTVPPRFKSLSQALEVILTFEKGSEDAQKAEKTIVTQFSLPEIRMAATSAKVEEGSLRAELTVAVTEIYLRLVREEIVAFSRLFWANESSQSQIISEFENEPLVLLMFSSDSEVYPLVENAFAKLRQSREVEQ